MNTTNQMQANPMQGMPTNMNNMGMNMQQMQGQNQQMPSQMFNNPQAMMGMMANNGQGQFQQQQNNVGLLNTMGVNQPYTTMNQKQREELNQKYKTERCRHYETHKNCLLKEKCHFAHGDEELRKPGDPFTPEQLILAQKSIQYQNCNQTPGKPQQQNQRGGRKPTMGGRGSFRGNGGQFGRGGNNMTGGRGNFQNFRGGQNGNNNGQYGSNRSDGQNGQNGQNRMNNHQNQNYQPQNGRSNSGGQSNQQQQQQQQQPQLIPTQGPNYKTVLCRHFQKRGYCKFGDKCCYAHGEAELRTAQSTPNGSKMRQSNGMNNQMPAPMGMDGMQNMNQFPGMMMQNQMGFPAQGMYNIDPNMNMQMMFNSQGSGNDPQNQQFGMMPNQFMQMQNQLMGMQLQQQQQQQQQQNYNMQPTVINFKKLENMPDGSQQQVNNTLSINQMEQTLESNKQIQEVCGLINNGDNDQAFMMLSKLKDQGKIQFSINKNAPMQNQVENAEQQTAMMVHEQKK